MGTEAPIKLVITFQTLPQPLASVMTAPSLQTWLMQLTGWVLIRRPAGPTAWSTRRRPRRRGYRVPTPHQMLGKRCWHIELLIYGRMESSRAAEAIARASALPE